MRVLIIIAVSCLLSSCSIFNAKPKTNPYNIGTEWCFEGDGETEKIKIEELTEVAKENCLRVEWFVINPAINYTNKSFLFSTKYAKQHAWKKSMHAS